MFKGLWKGPGLNYPLEEHYRESYSIFTAGRDDGTLKDENDLLGKKKSFSNRDSSQKV